MKSLKLKQIGIAVLIVLALLASSCMRPRPSAQPNLSQVLRPAKELAGKTPIIVIPGMLGSRLENSSTGKKVWPRAHPNEEALQLPISPDLKKNRDDVVATELVEATKAGLPIPEIKVYEDLIETLTVHAGYKRGNIDAPAADGDRDTVYLFAYDWRRDNVETAQRLGEKIAHLKQKLQRPDLRFNIIAHSMGGLVARYYLMYGGEDVLDRPEAKVTWKGAGDINKLALVGAPNEGTMDALRALAEGFPIAEGSLGRFFGKVEAETAFTMPAAFQLLPHRGNQEFYDARLQPVSANLYELETWRRYRWSIYGPAQRRSITKRLQQRFGVDWRRHFDNYVAEREAYLKVVLERARLFSEALDKKADLATPLKVFIFAGDCERTLRAALIIEEKGEIKTIFKPSKAKLKGEGLSPSLIEAKLYEPGDGRITRRSALAVDRGEWVKEGSDSSNRALPIFGCELHADLPNNPTFQDNMLTIFLK